MSLMLYRNEIDQCHTVINKLVDLARNVGSRTDYRAALECTLPTSPIYDVLEGRVPHPGFTYMRTAEITEADERERINKEIGERRTRLGARLDQVNTEVRRDIFGKSELEGCYENVIKGRPLQPESYVRAVVRVLTLRPIHMALTCSTASYCSYNMSVRHEIGM